MSDKDIILSVSLNASSSVKALEELRTRIASLKDEQKLLTTNTKEGREQSIAYQAQITNLTKEARSLENAIEKTAGSFNFQKGSIASNRAELSRLTAEYKNLANPTKEQTKTINDLSAKLKEQEAQIGLTNRNVGNYTQSILSAGLGNNQLFASIQNAQSGFTGLKSGVMSASGGFDSLKAAIIGTGIGALVIAVVALASAFMKTEAGGEAVSRIFAGIKAVIAELIGRAGALANAFVSLVSGDFKGATEQASKAFNNLGESMAKAYKAGSDLERQLQELEDRQINQSVANRQLVNEVELLIKQSKDRTKTDRERLTFLELAKEKTSNLAKEELDVAKQLLERERKLFEQRKKTGEVSEENKFDKQLADAEIAYLDKVASVEEKIQVIENRKASFILELEKEKEERRRKDEDAFNRELERQKELQRLAEEALQKRIDEVKQLDDSERALINERNDRDVQATQLRIDNSKKQLQVILKNENISAEEKIRIEQENTNLILAEIDKRLQKEITANVIKTASATEQEGLNAFQITSIQEAGKAKEIELTRKAEEEKRNLVKQSVEFELTEKKKLIELERVKNLTALQGAGQLFGALSGLAKQNSAEFKALAIAEATINAIVGANKAFAQGGVAGFLTGSAVLVAGLANVAKIQALKDGVIDLQGEGTETSDSNLALLSRGESVMTAKETRMFKPQLQRMRAIANRNRFANGVIDFNAGNVAGSSLGAKIETDNTVKMLTRAIASMPSPQVSVREIIDTQNKVAVKTQKTNY